MFKFVLLLCAVAGFNARPLQYNAPRIQNGGWVIGAPQLVQNGQEYMGNPERAEHHKQSAKVEPQWEVVNMNQKAAPTEERRQGTEPSRRFLVDLNTGLLKEYISEMDRRAEVYIPTYKSEFRQGTQNSRVTLVNTRTGQQLPQLSEMQRRAEPLSEFRQGTEYSEAALMKLRNDQIMERMEFRQGTENSRVTLVNIKTGQKLPRLSEMQRRTKEEAKVETIHQAVLPELRRQGTEPSRHVLVEPNTGLVKEQVNEMERSVSGYEFKQGNENNLVALKNPRNAQMIGKVGKDKNPHTVQDVEDNEVFASSKTAPQESSPFPGSRK
ncbi:hypothetical protein HF521_013042 [Silurus meridionalis]|uniref:Uncharacterized protein n=1 Tax=Silurus meridionalis TaxID=175797 RepID=A0A8T0AEE9_SILME|nr:hypothetical protein HF521_013042 [Silurus meridionalis]